MISLVKYRKTQLPHAKNCGIMEEKGVFSMTLHQGRPEDCTGRLSKEVRVYDLLDSLGIHYQRIDHEPAMTMEACEKLDTALGVTICKNLFLCNRQCTKFYLLMLPGNKVFKTKELSAQLGCSRLSFASGEFMEALLDITPGSLSILGLMNDGEQKVQLLIDEDLLKDEYIGCHPCINTSTLRIRTQDVIQTLIPAMRHAAKTVALTGAES